MDREFLDSAGINADELKEFVATGASDPEVDRWIKEMPRSRFERNPCDYESA